MMPHNGSAYTLPPTGLPVRAGYAAPAPGAGLRRLDFANVAGFRQVRARLVDVLADGSLAPAQPVLIDLRDIGFLPTTPEAEALADEFSSQDTLGAHAVALLVHAGAQFGIARMVCTLAELRGGRVKAFTDDRAAVDWLMG